MCIFVKNQCDMNYQVFKIMRKLLFLPLAALLVLSVSCKKNTPTPEPTVQLADCYLVKDRPVKGISWEYTPGKFRSGVLEWDNQGRLAAVCLKNSETEGEDYLFTYLRDSMVFNMRMYDGSDEVNITNPVSVEGGYAKNFWTLISLNPEVYELALQCTFEDGHLVSKKYAESELPETFAWENGLLVSRTTHNGDTWHYTYTDKPAKGGIAALLLDEGPRAYSLASSYIFGFCGIPLLPSKIEFQASGSTERRVEFTFNYETDSDGYVTGMTFHQRTLGDFEPSWTFTY